jgi:hypothetical protein
LRERAELLLSGKKIVNKIFIRLRTETLELQPLAANAALPARGGVSLRWKAQKLPKRTKVDS